MDQKESECFISVSYTHLDVYKRQVYRDSLLQQSDGSYNKANAAYSFGGVEGAVALLNKNLDMNIEHYVTVNFNALSDVVDALGGLDIEMTHTEAELTNGYLEEVAKVTGREFEMVDGYEAVSYTHLDVYKRQVLEC